VTPADRTLAAGGLQLHYLDWPGPGEPIVFAHGGGLTAHTWDGVCAALSAGHRCVAFDLRGHGESGWADAYGIADHARDIGALIDELAPARPFLVGHSLGGLASLTYAGEHGDRLSGLALIDVDVTVKPGEVESIAAFFAAPREFASIDEALERARAFNPRRDRASLLAGLEWNLKPSAGGLTWRYDPRAVETALAAVAGGLEAQRAAVPDVPCPVLVVWGALSGVLGPHRAPELAAEFRDGTSARVDDAGHTVQGDNPPGLVAALRPWLAQTAAV
jgi:pimeloyl-ACP methyl ester carboxylesterase